MKTELRLALLGGATIYQEERKFDVTATIYAEGPAPAESFFGHYDLAITRRHPERRCADLSDCSEAEAVLAAVDPDRGGFRLTSPIRDLSGGG